MVSTFNNTCWPLVTLSFQNKIEVEQIRALEENGHALVARFDSEQCPSFDAWLVARTNALKQQGAVQAALQYAPALYSRILLSVGFLLTLLGIVSTGSLLSQAQSTLNIFWLLGALLGINALSLFIWMVLAANFRNSSGGVIPAIAHQLMIWLIPSGQDQSYKSAASRVWFTAQLHPQFHHWYLGRLAHLAWSFFLLGNILGLLLLFATRQFDFVWESTILSADTFIQLSQWLATPLQWLGLTTPSEADILRSGTAAVLPYSGELRQQWALFLIGCLAIYGLLPRLIAALVCLGLEHRGRRQWKLDLSLPYYRQLQRQYWPSTTQSAVIDPDHSQPVEPKQPSEVSIAERPVPTDAHWLGLELHPQLPWPGFESPAYLGQITDSQSLHSLSARISELNTPVAIAIEANKVPDRGLQRNLRGILVHCRHPWLALIDNGNVSDSKWQNWIETAHTLGFADTQITRIKVMSK